MTKNDYMDQSQLFMSDEREKLYAQLAEAMISALEHGLMTDEESAESSDFVLKKLEAIQMKNEVLPFLAELSRRWSAYVSVYQDRKKDELLVKVSVELDQMKGQG